MKVKILSVLMAAIFWSMTVAAQPMLGVKGGVNWANFQGDYDTEERVTNEMNKGMTFGFLVDLPLHGNLSLQPELNYLEKGTVLRKYNMFGHYDLTWKYLELPVLAKYRFDLGTSNFYLTAGPSLGYAISGERDIDLWLMEVNDEGGTTELVTEQGDYSFRSEFDQNGRKDNRLDFGLMFGGGLEFKVGPGMMLLDTRYGMDFTDNIKFETTAPENYNGTHHRDFMVTVGYGIRLGK